VKVSDTPRRNAAPISMVALGAARRRCELRDAIAGEDRPLPYGAGRSAEIDVEIAIVSGEESTISSWFPRSGQLLKSHAEQGTGRGAGTSLRDGSRAGQPSTYRGEQGAAPELDDDRLLDLVKHRALRLLGPSAGRL